MENYGDTPIGNDTTTPAGSSFGNFLNGFTKLATTGAQVYGAIKGTVSGKDKTKTAVATTQAATTTNWAKIAMWGGVAVVALIIGVVTLRSFSRKAA